jgi:hypothetical protein
MCKKIKIKTDVVIFKTKIINNKNTTRNRTNPVGYGYIEGVELQGLWGFRY